MLDLSSTTPLRKRERKKIRRGSRISEPRLRGSLNVSISPCSGDRARPPSFGHAEMDNPSLKYYAAERKRKYISSFFSFSLQTVIFLLRSRAY